MDYFMGSLRGNAKAYFETKKKIGFCSKDKLFILGNILFGNSIHPEDSIKILDDILNSHNIELIAGKQEVLYCFHHIEKKKEKKLHLQKEILEMDPSGYYFMQYVNSNLTSEQREFYFEKLLKYNCSKMIRVGNRLVYMVTGSPVNRRDEFDSMRWQWSLCTERIDLERDYLLEIGTDPNIDISSSEIAQKQEDIIIICNNSVLDILQRYPDLNLKRQTDNFSQYQNIIMYNKKIVLDCGCRADRYDAKLTPTLACVGLDEDNVKVTYAHNLF